MILATLAALVFLSDAACPIAASAALPELTGTWQVLQIFGVDRPQPDSATARATFSPELQSCLIREQLRAERGTPPYEALILWGANGADGSIQRILAHSQHGRFGMYEGRRSGGTITLRQLSNSVQPSAEIVENVVLFRDADHFVWSSRLSSDAGRTWQELSRWEYARARP
jgi:hypothetical protein